MLESYQDSNPTIFTSWKIDRLPIADNGKTDCRIWQIESKLPNTPITGTGCRRQYGEEWELAKIGGIGSRHPALSRRVFRDPRGAKALKRFEFSRGLPGENHDRPAARGPQALGAQLLKLRNLFPGAGRQRRRSRDQARNLRLTRGGNFRNYVKHWPRARDRRGNRSRHLWANSPPRFRAFAEIGS